MTVRHVPSAFNSQTTRVVLLLGESHKKLWQIVKDALKKIVPAEAFAKTLDAVRDAQEKQQLKEEYERKVLAQEAKDALHTKVLTLADQAEEAYVQAVEFLHPPTREEEAQAIAEFEESLPESLKNVGINSPQRRV